MPKHRPLDPLTGRGPLRAAFVITSMPVGGAETLLVNLVRRLDRGRFDPEICCLKEQGPLGAELANEIPVHSNLLGSKYDVRVLGRLTSLFRRRRIDAVVTVGAGDKMFWGRLAAWRAGVPVVCSALHSTGWPDSVGRLNRVLTPLTDAFVGVAQSHGRHLVEEEGFPADKVVVIPNGVDTERFSPQQESSDLRVQVGLPPEALVVSMVAALRPEKNHSLLLRVAARVLGQVPEAHFVIVGDGPERERLTTYAEELRLPPRVHFLGTRSDVPQILAMTNVFVLTSHNEANPVSILEAMSSGCPVVATDVGSVRETVHNDHTGCLVPAGDEALLATRVRQLLRNTTRARELGAAGRGLVLERWSLEAMVRGYEDMLARIYSSKVRRQIAKQRSPQQQRSTIGG